MLCWDSDDENWVDPSFFKQVKAIKKNCKLAHNVAVETLIFLFFFYQTSQWNTCTADIFTLYWTKICSQNSKLKKKVTTWEAALSVQPLVVSAHGWWHDQLRLFRFHLKVVFFFGHELLYPSLFPPLSFSPFLFLFLFLSATSSIVVGKKAAHLWSFSAFSVTSDWSGNNYSNNCLARWHI